MKYQIVFDSAKCVSCGACAVACMDQCDIDTAAGCLPFRTVTTEETPTAAGTAFSFRSVSCMHCKEAACIAVCPTGCLCKDEEMGFTVYDSALCIACRRCAEACPIAHPRFDSADGKMHKCDGCAERVKHGLKPACVKVCPFGALQLLPSEA